MSFRLKTILGIAIIEGVLLLLLVYMSIHYLKQSNAYEIEKRSNITIGLFTIAAKDALINDDRSKLTLLAKELSLDPEVSYVNIYSHKDLLVAMHRQDDKAIWDLSQSVSANEQDTVFDVETPIEYNGIHVGNIQMGFDRAANDDLIRQASAQFLSIAGLEMLLVALFSWLLGLYLTRNLSQLQKAAKQILAGEVGVQIPVSGNDEIAQTASAFNQMVENIDARTHALTGANIRLNTILESAADGFVIINVDGIITEANQAVSKLFSYSVDELVGKNVSMLMPAAERHMHDGYLHQYLTGGQAKIIGKGRELIAEDKHGKQFPFDLTVSKMIIDDEVFFLGFLKDLTDVRLNQAAAARSESILIATIESSQDALITIDVTGRVQEYNTAAVELFGYSREEAIGELLEDLIIPVNFQQAHRKGMDYHRQTGKGAVLNKRIEVPAHNKAGEEFPVELRVIPIQLGDEVMFTAFLRNVSEQKSREEELRQAKEQAEAGSKAKSRFLATMSHEIRSPLNAVLGSVELLLDSSLQQQQRIYATTAKEAGDALLNTINDILDFSKIEAGQMVLESHEFEPDKLVSQVLQILANKATEKGVHLACFINRNVPQRLVGDPQRLRQVIHNLVDNAIKFSDSGCVTVEVWIPDSHQQRVKLCCSVTDQGIGISEQAQSKLFTEFSQVHNTHTTNYKGTGLGLAICSELAKMMDGEITVESRLGQGSRFNLSVTLDESTEAVSHYVRLPEHSRVLVIHPNLTLCKMVKKQLTQYGVQTVYIDKVDEIFKLSHVRGRFDVILLDDSYIMKIEPKLVNTLQKDFVFNNGILLALSNSVNSGFSSLLAELGIEQVVNKPLSRSMLLSLISGATQDNLAQNETDLPPSLPANCHILLVEDSPANQLVAGTMLTKFGAQVEYANNGLEAVKMALNDEFDLILMDIRMPEMDGLEATTLILQQKPQQIILAMTANVFKEELAACTNVGMKDFIGKPVNIKNLIKGVAKWLPEKRLKTNLAQGMSLSISHTDDLADSSDISDVESSQAVNKVNTNPVSVSMPEAEATVKDNNDTAKPATDLLDYLVLNDLKQTLGEASLVNMLKVFCKETQMRIEILTELGAQGPRDKIENEAHTLKSSAGSFGASALFEVAKKLEAAAREADVNSDAEFERLFEQTLALSHSSIVAINSEFKIS